MKRLVKKRELISMDLTPLIDVVFLLLIFFIVASEFKKNETVLNINLPNSASLEVVEKKEIQIEISENEFSYNANKINLEQLKQELSVLKKDTPLTLRIDKEVKYSRIVTVLDILNELDLTNLLLITKEKELVIYK